MVSRDGYVKILDFGLAKLVEPERVGSGSEVVTAISGTQAGTVLGTIGYMSPEQAAGRAVDFRSDQFSLGTILYEMAAGRKPFERDSSAETLTAIIREEPEPLLQAAPRLPAPLRWVIERCLAKDPEERYASTKDLARELEMLRRRLGETSGSGETAAVVGDAASDRFPTFQRLTFRRGTILSARFAPDGQTVIYGASWEGQPCRLFSTRPESPESSALALPEAEILSISTTGQMASLSTATGRGASSGRGSWPRRRCSAGRRGRSWRTCSGPTGGPTARASPSSAGPPGSAGSSTRWGRRSSRRRAGSATSAFRPTAPGSPFSTTPPRATTAARS